MKVLEVSHSTQTCLGELTITGSKSETNRLKILQALYPKIEIENASASDDSIVMEKAIQSSESIIDIQHAGTAMRFLTAYFSIQEGKEIILTGSERMQQRPIKVLVEALRQLGVPISYLNNEGFPPLKINGIKNLKNEVSLAANISSQYITALMLIGSSLKKGLRIHLTGKITSLPYLKMSLSLLQEIGVDANLINNIIDIKPVQEISPKKVWVESDWSSASYFFSIVALSQHSEIHLSYYKPSSLQGDKVVMDIFHSLGVSSTLEKNKLILKNEGTVVKHFSMDMSSCPDLAQTVAVTCFGLGISCELTGLHTLKIKETDRIEALNSELSKLGAQVETTAESLTIKKRISNIKAASIETYHDHRMALSFAPLGLLKPIIIKDADVVSKSFPTYWKDLEKLGFSLVKK